jgi:calnexin
MQNDILFDNIYIGHSIEDAEALRKETFDVKKPIERAEEELQKPKPEDKPQTGVSFKEDPVAYIREKVDLFITLAKQDPVQAVQAVPEVAGGLGAILLATILFIVGVISASSPAPAKVAQKGKAAASAAKEKTAEAVSSATDTAKGATKRTTRASAE